MTFIIGILNFPNQLGWEENIYAPVHLIGYFGAVGVRLGALADPEVGIGPGAVVVQIRNVEGLAVEDRYVVAAQSVGQPRKFRQHAHRRDVHVRWDVHRAKVYLEFFV